MKVLTIAAVGLKRFLRERENVFFVFIFPILIILFMGLQFGSGSVPTLGMVGAETPVGENLVQAVADSGFDILEFDSETSAIEAVELRTIEAAVVVEDLDPVASARPVEARFFSREGFGLELRSTVQAAVTDMSTKLRASRYVAENSNLSPADAEILVEELSNRIEVVEVSVTMGGVRFFEGMEQFDLGASSQLVLFTFLTSLSTSGHLILTRKLGVSARMLVSPTGVGTIVVGETLGRYAVALVQALFIVVVTALMFGVDWGDPWGAAALVGAFALVSTAAGMLLGSFVQNDQQAGGLGVMLGIGLAALGGAMVPYEIFPDSVQRISQYTPHYWALRGFRDLLFADGGLGTVALEVGILAGIGGMLLVLAAWAYRRAIVS